MLKCMFYLPAVLYLIYIGWVTFKLERKAKEYDQWIKDHGPQKENDKLEERIQERQDVQQQLFKKPPEPGAFPFETLPDDIPEGYSNCDKPSGGAGAINLYGYGAGVTPITIGKADSVNAKIHNTDTEGSR